VELRVATTSRSRKGKGAGETSPPKFYGLNLRRKDKPILLKEEKRPANWHRSPYSYDPEIEREISGRFGEIQMLRKIPDEDTIMGVVDVLGVNCHIVFVRVEEREDEQGVMTQQATNDPHSRFDDLYALDSEVYFQTVQVPGFSGQYIFAIHPFGR